MFKICFFFLLTSSFAWALNIIYPKAASWAPVVDKEARILRNEREHFEDGSYRFYYETSKEKRREEESQATVITGTYGHVGRDTGYIVNYTAEGEELRVVGSYAHTGPDGKFYLVKYVADRNGFQPTVTIVAPEKSFLFGSPGYFEIRPDVLKSLLG